MAALVILTSILTGGAGGAQAAPIVLASAGVSEVAITELDIAGGRASDYTIVVKACLAVSQCVGITRWRVSDKNSWRESTNPSSSTRTTAYNAVIAALGWTLFVAIVKLSNAKLY